MKGGEMIKVELSLFNEYFCVWFVLEELIFYTQGYGLSKSHR